MEKSQEFLHSEIWCSLGSGQLSEDQKYLEPSSTPTQFGASGPTRIQLPVFDRARPVRAPNDFHAYRTITAEMNAELGALGVERLNAPLQSTHHTPALMATGSTSSIYTCACDRG